MYIYIYICGSPGTPLVWVGRESCPGHGFSEVARKSLEAHGKSEGAIREKTFEATGAFSRPT